ncbi:protein-lysine methyltransferase METTL21B [Phalaenopsis equestris]|uniref:protein-lysine methyltransferase METTL21B n=1 Tax=Phalaenopsis equestris TaxID=78828 RepID=UPI0009E5DADE|nr:protein-lysine methyltransferase METTL21B [Phalaenopsis equestris]XP_020589707.1 protein-lysine methyltransferase METTL21B [Phalaenopsis equestris]XP_020589708.1 protein-lysine methyltransferase METTL21B [Phalaenopsis equestris]
MDTAIFSPSSLFHDEDDEGKDVEEANLNQLQNYEERTHTFAGVVLTIREFSFHQFNANLLWPGTFAFCEWLSQNRSLIEGQRILELGSGTGALAIFIRRFFGVDITTSDFDDEEVEENIAYNCKANEVKVLPHVRHTWVETFPVLEPDWDLIIATDILLYVKQYPNLIKTLSFLLKNYKQRNIKSEVTESSQHRRILTASGEELQLQQPVFLMSWRRRLGGEESLFFSGCEDAGLVTTHIGSRVYCISSRRET